MIRFSKYLFKDGVNSLQELLSKINQEEKERVENFFHLTSITFEELITNNKHSDYKSLFITVRQLTESYNLQKKEKRIIFLIIGFYIFLSEFFPNRDERESFQLLILKLFKKNNSDYLIYLENGRVLGGCSIINLEFKSHQIIWNTYVFVTSSARGRGILKEFYIYLEVKKPAMIMIEVENPYSYFDNNTIRDIFEEDNYYPSLKKHWVLIRGYGSEIDHFSRLIVWSKMGFLLPTFKIIKENLRYSVTYPYIQPELGYGRNELNKLILLFKILDPKIELSYTHDIDELQKIIHLELNSDSYQSLSANYKIKLSKIHNNSSSFSSLAMSALRNATKNIIK